MTNTKPIGILILGSLLSLASVAGHLDDARKYRGQGKNIESALSATKGCMERDGAEACSFLCALGLETSTQSWIDAGCGSACTKGIASSCTTLGSRKIMSGQNADGLKFLKMGCALGDKLGCSQLKLLGN